MDFKEEYKRLLEIVKSKRKKEELPWRNEDIAEILGYHRTYFSNLIGKRGVVTGGHIKALKLNFPYLGKITFENEDVTLNEPAQTYTEQRRAKNNKSTAYMVPFIPIKAQAGYVRAIDQEVYLDTLEKYALPPGVSGHGAIWRYWEVEGDSMEPTFKAGDIVLTSFVHPMDWENMRNFYTYVIVTHERILIKRIYHKNALEWVLISDNEELYKQQLISVESIKEVWVYRKTWSTRAAPPKEFKINV